MKNSTLRITFLLTQSLESPGGGGRYFPLAKALQALGHQVTIIALHHNFKNLETTHFYKDNIEIKYVGQMHVHKSSHGKKYYSTPTLLWITFIATFKLTLEALKANADILQVCKTQPMNIIPAWITYRIRKIPIYVDSDDFETENNRFGASWQQKIVSWFENGVTSFASGISVGNQFIAQHFINLGYNPANLIILHNGVDKSRFSILKRQETKQQIQEIRKKINIQPNQRIVVYIGSISLTSHAIDLLLESFVKVIQEQPEVCLLIIGSGEDMAKIQKLTTTLNINNYVHFLGRIPIEKVPFYFFLGDLSVDPMRNSIQAQSSLSLKLIESIVSGTPCVTSDIGDRKQIIGNAGIAVPPNDPQQLSEAILSILNNPEIRENMHREALNIAPSHYWSNKVNKLEGLYLQN